MTPDEMRRAIANDQGWTPCHMGCNGKTWRNPQDTGCQPELPDYLSDLNAIHAAALERFKDELDAEEFRWSLETVWQIRHKRCFRWQLTALDWCEAYIRIIGKR